MSTMLIDIIAVAFLAIGGLLGGAFLTVIVHRGPVVWGFAEKPDNLPEHYSLSYPPSHCPACQARIPIWALIPFFGYFLTGGKCAVCGVRINLRYPLLEGGGALLGVLCWVTFGDPLTAGLALVALLLLVGLAYFDHDTGYLPDALTFPLIGIALFASLLGAFVSPQESIAGLLIGWLSFWALATLYRALRGQEGLGGGDVKLLGGLGALLGAFALPIIILTASLSALVAAAVQSIAKKEQLSRTGEIRFGPYLAAAGGILLLTQAWWRPLLLGI